MTEQSDATLNAGLSRIEMLAAGSSGAIIVAGITFWTIQIINVVEMLSLAYGWQ